MENDRVFISIDLFLELAEAQAVVDALVRYLDAEKYPAVKAIKAIVGMSPDLESD